MTARPLTLCLSLLAVATALPALTGCQVEPEMVRCIDNANAVAADQFCQAGPRRVAVRGSLYDEMQYRHYYGGYGGSEAGSTAWGGSDRPLAGHWYQSAEVRNGDGQRTGGSIGTAPTYYSTGGQGSE